MKHGLYRKGERDEAGHLNDKMLRRKTVLLIGFSQVFMAWKNNYIKMYVF